MEGYWEGAMAAATMTYDSGAGIEYEDIPRTEEPVYLLGEKYSALYDRQEIRLDVLSRIWCTYRKGFSSIGSPVGPNSDTGWGCMLRCGQMMLAQSLVLLHLGRQWRWSNTVTKSNSNNSTNMKYQRVLELFADRRSAPYSIHQVAAMGVSEGKSIGSWFGPNTVAQVIRKLAVYEDWSNLAVHVALDNALIIDDLRTLCSEVDMRCRCRPFTDLASASSSTTSSRSSSAASSTSFTQPSERVLSASAAATTLPEGYASIDAVPEYSGNSGGGCAKCRAAAEASRAQSGGLWRPLLLFIPLRLGLSDLNECYAAALRECFGLRHSVGMIGGKPNHAHWFIGCVGDDLLFLDPHTSQPVVQDLSDDNSYHCPLAGRMPFMKLDPSVALGFFCRDEKDLDELCEQLIRQVLRPFATPMFEVHQRRPRHWPPFQPYAAPTLKSENADDIENEYSLPQQPNYDSDEFELV